MLARRIEPSEAVGARFAASRREPTRRAGSRPGRRTPPRRTTRGPRGEVRWWERPAPGGDEELWRAVIRCHEALQRRRWSVTELAWRLRLAGHPVARETLSKVLNGRQRTSWATVEQLARILDIDLPGREQP
ncbi:XRE family transcriptional regulator [Egibacter rhizosphaerae]|uniref:XRE family transcriptional regulator n=1 Tax=Egibacter rhizosphaerae TaxID=1670831 RepID=A0A411YCR7_9ACTN|nr:helix-turn-helix transcriptional regulator [Egibacter rhizosphaerae]QBI19014.1 XRE family transcriptional regulator [Egibacter rhizosphaerae]